MYQRRLSAMCVVLVGFTLFASSLFMPARAVADNCDSLLSCCDCGTPCRQFYLGTIVGADFGTLNKTVSVSVPNQSLFTAGGTVGMRSFRENGALRVEFEGRGRDIIGRSATDFGLTVNDSAKFGWSTMANVWRDWDVIGNIDVYAGGGLGAGGYRNVVSDIPAQGLFSADNNVAAFAWQAGGGLIYDMSNRVAVDLGYRFFSITDTTQPLTTFAGPTTYTSNYSASEVLLTLRIYEPFRRWR